jgi:hypothetical protein
VIGSYDIPSVWTRPDDVEQAAAVVATAERVLAELPATVHPGIRARLLATIAVESRGTAGSRGPEAALAAESIARDLDDPALLARALNGVYLQSCQVAGSAGQRDAVGQELVTLATRSDLPTAALLGHLVRMQACSALGDFGAADEHAAAADRLAADHERPLAPVLTHGYRAMRRAAAGASLPQAEAAYREVAAQLAEAEMPGVREGLLLLALLCLRVWRREPCTGLDDLDPGPYASWVRPHLLLAAGRRAEAVAALRRIPDPPPGLLLEALWCVTARAAVTLHDRPTVARALRALTPARAEIAGAGSGLLTAGPVAEYLDELTAVR